MKRFAPLATGCVVLAAPACGRTAAARPVAEIYPDACVVDPNDDEHPTCLRADGDAYRVNPTLLRALAPAGRQLFSLRTHAGFFRVRADGFARRTPVFDNWADDFCDGLTRTLHGEHVRRAHCGVVHEVLDRRYAWSHRSLGGTRLGGDLGAAARGARQRVQCAVKSWLVKVPTRTAP